MLKMNNDNIPWQFCVLVTCTAVLVMGCSAKEQSNRQNMISVEKKGYLVGGYLPSCHGKSNCVSSENFDGDAYVEPFKFSGSLVRQWQSLQDEILEMGGKIEEVNDQFLHATFKSTVFRFVDDVTCRLDDETNSIQIRSASRFGYSDFGVNRKRVEELRRRLQNRQSVLEP